MESASQVIVPLRSGGKKMRKRRELDALVAHSLGKRACNIGKRQVAGNGVNSQDQLLSQSTDDQEDYSWSKVRMSSRSKSKHYSFLRICGPLLFVVSIFLMFGFMYWLYFDLREQLYDHRLKIEQVSASSQNVPEAIQKWHESSKFLEQNQTVLSASVYEIKIRIEKMEKDFVQLKEAINKKDENSESAKISSLQNSLADFGAKLQEVTLNVDALKNYTREGKTLVENDRAQLIELQQQFAANSNTSTASMVSDLNRTQEMINAARIDFAKEMKNLSSSLSNVNDTLSQKTNEINIELRKHKIILDALSENYANVSSHVISMENEWPTYKQTSQSLTADNSKILSELETLHNESNHLSAMLHNLEEKFKQSQDNPINIPAVNENKPNASPTFEFEGKIPNSNARPMQRPVPDAQPGSSTAEQIPPKSAAANNVNTTSTAKEN